MLHFFKFRTAIKAGLSASIYGLIKNFKRGPEIPNENSSGSSRSSLKFFEYEPAVFGASLWGIDGWIFLTDKQSFTLDHRKLPRFRCFRNDPVWVSPSDIKSWPRSFVTRDRGYNTKYDNWTFQEIREKLRVFGCISKVDVSSSFVRISSTLQCDSQNFIYLHIP